MKLFWCFIIFLMLLLPPKGSADIWQLKDEILTAVEPSPDMEIAPQTGVRLTGDLDNLEGEECLELTNQSLQITDCAEGVLWQSPQSWKVTEAQTGDLNRDGQSEAILLVWRPFEPWPSDRFMPHGGRINSFHDRDGNSAHVILIGWKRGRFDEIWAGSAMHRPLSQLTIADLDNDGWQELAALEGGYDSSGPGGALTIWKWQGFSFTLVTREGNRYRELNVIRHLEDVWIVAQ